MADLHLSSSIQLLAGFLVLVSIAIIPVKSTVLRGNSGGDLPPNWWRTTSNGKMPEFQLKSLEYPEHLVKGMYTP